jgi:hypothetical protein
MKYLLMVTALLFAGCIAVPVGGGGGYVAEPAVVVGPSVVLEPFPFVWGGPGYYGGSYYGQAEGRYHSDHGFHGHR